MTAYTGYRPHGENLAFTLDFSDDIASSEQLFAHTIRALDHLSAVARPTRADLWLGCAFDGTWLETDDPEPSEAYWEVLERDVPAATAFPPVGPPATTKRVHEITGESMRTIYRQALSSATCPDGYFVMFKGIWPDGYETRIVDVDESAAGGQLPVTLWDRDLVLSTDSRTDGTTWLTPLSDDFPALPPVTFRIDYDIAPNLTLAVNWSRWMEKGTGEHELLQSAVSALIADGWKSNLTPTFFTVDP
ncbi:hypothetical protein ACWZHB_33105 [Nocardia sp. FBN12]|uniref:hypothetical protein n=1 Tax=Nocardia sp. FBN12 TaxID=3419766 RepID=UPI003D0131A7